jgi:UDP-N-acetyl-D-mannosaminuronate dehydrogenase
VQLGRPLPQARGLVVGASYKPGVADTREAPALEIIARLRAEGARVDYHDPLVPTLVVDGVRSRAVAADSESYDLAILTTLHPGHDYDWLEHCPAVLDCTYRQHAAGRKRFTP